MNRFRKTVMPQKLPRRFNPGIPVLAGVAAGLALAAAWSAWQHSQRHGRRYADHATERRTPLTLFITGNHPRRRQIDRSGTHPLFERRQAVYDAY